MPGPQQREGHQRIAHGSNKFTCQYTSCRQDQLTCRAALGCELGGLGDVGEGHGVASVEAGLAGADDEEQVSSVVRAAGCGAGSRRCDLQGQACSCTASSESMYLTT